MVMTIALPTPIRRRKTQNVGAFGAIPLNVPNTVTISAPAIIMGLRPIRSDMIPAGILVANRPKLADARAMPRDRLAPITQNAPSSLMKVGSAGMVIIIAAWAVAVSPPTMTISSGRSRLCLADSGTEAMCCPCPCYEAQMWAINLRILAEVVQEFAYAGCSRLGVFETLALTLHDLWGGLAGELLVGEPTG